MSRILITSGPTREYLDPVRYLSNGSSGRMGTALATALLEVGHQVVVVSGPVEAPYPAAAEVIGVVSTEDMLWACQKVFPTCDGLIAVAAPCDYRPVSAAAHKIKKTGKPLVVELVETPDIVAELAKQKGVQWIVGFALETEDVRLRAMQKLERKNCDLIVMNGPQAIHAADTQVEMLDRRGESLGRFAGSKSHVARQIVAVLGSQFFHRNR
jgi:phosphopantothenoylcysteine decarboxylase / phosphopantothenate---cysteine ligase